MPTPIRAVLVLSVPYLALAAFGCASGSGGGGGTVYGADFPSQRDVARIENAPPPEAVFDADLRQVEEWVIESPVPERIERRPWVQRSAWGDLLEREVGRAGGQAVPTAAMHCVASELARFALLHGGQPDLSLHRFLVSGCNASVGHASIRSLQGDVGSGEDDEALFERWRDDTLGMVRSALESGQPSVVGIGFARRGNQAAAFVASGRPLVELEPVATSLRPGQALELRGRALAPAETITAVINHGRYRSAVCEPVGDPKPPAFHLVCEPDPADHSAWVSLSFNPPNRVLGRRALNPLVYPRGTQARVYRPVAYTRPRPIADVARFASAFLEELNGVRAQADLAPLTLEPAQSATASRVAPHFFAAVSGSGDERVADEVALGLLAGWEVEGDIRTAGFAFGAVPETDDLSVLLGTTLEEPMSRGALLDPEVERLAIGSIVGDAGGVPMLAALVTTYALFDPATKHDDAEALFARLAEERHGLELPAPMRLVRLWGDAMHSADQVGHGQPPRYALDDLLQASSSALRREVRGWYGETSALEEFEFPPELVSSSRLETAIGVSHAKDPDAAWGRYIVLIVSAH